MKVLDKYYNNPLQKLVFHKCDTPIQLKWLMILFNC